MRILARVGGSLLIFIGVLAIAVAIVTMKFIGKDNTIMMDPRTVSTAGPAVTTGKGLLSYYDTTLTVQVKAKDPKAKVWIGIAHQDDLSSYLADKSRAEIISYQYPDQIGINNYRGVDNDLVAPAQLDWWVASAKGTGSAQLSWPMRNAAYGAVIMNQNGSRKFSGDVGLGLQIKGVFETAELAGLGGLIGILLGIGVFIATRPRRRPTPDPTIGSTPADAGQTPGSSASAGSDPATDADPGPQPSASPTTARPPSTESDPAGGR
ncbi:hypothetical protein [Microlunatus soli]|uniref:Uncharacterized protein n=1 Tax=Microlunatus soli TaxID=630515 RepID=A0A1H1R8G1_9ACTN|nr:hypothetical protein [Microlunatus soli]SDS31973.1 hypothetical protein SAMN04489812_1550 [Microlunatus soli]